uniref:Uncharacterized protein n=1 Tax=Parietochloris pseudoalveolaris TaxID=3102 RepID=A0A097KLN1_9CHLO|nr:hypothetical protein [Parietochloris pseudoalveolaris]AIT94093.1 hypothetical protein [Parietochloris pseudoalveolaris]
MQSNDPETETILAALRQTEQNITSVLKQEIKMLQSQITSNQLLLQQLLITITNKEELIFSQAIKNNIEAQAAKIQILDEIKKIKP